MKKTIQINIAGIVFNIEEDAFGKLDSYLKSIQSYFSNYEGSQEIISDIEARVAEKFLEKQKNDSQTIITQEDVSTLISSMGTVADFEAIEEEEDLISDKSSAKSSSSSASTSYSTASTPTGTSERKRLFRDTKRKALGGVLAGFANYFHIDVTWIRIIFLLLFFSLSPVTDSGLSGILFIAYIVCWVAFPPKDDLEEDPKIKKFYRNPDEKVVGGVASGLAAYFGIDIAIIRLLFVGGVLFFGTGLIAYIILWVASPEAATLTQKMEMKGEPVTLENIETNVKRNLNVSGNAPENGFTKLVLLPFRLLAALIAGLGTLLKNLGPVVRIVAGIILLIMGMAFGFAVMVAVSVFFGLSTNPEWLEGSQFFHFFTRDISPWAGFFGFLAFILPALAVILLGLSLITNKRIGNRSYWLTGLGIWIFGIMGASAMGAKYSLNFAKNATHEVAQNFTVPAGILLLDSNDNEENEVDFHVEVALEGTNTNELVVEKEFKAAGSTKAVALENARNITHQVVQKDSALIFDEDIQLSKAVGFREQQLRMTLQIPYNKPFKMTPNFAYHLLENRWNLTDKYSIDTDDIKNFTFVMKPDEGIVCLDCPVLTEEEKEAYEHTNDNDFESGIVDDEDFERGHEFKKTFNESGFTKLAISNAFDVVVRQGDAYSIEVEAENKRDLEDIDISTKGNTLEIEYEDAFMINRGDVNVYITMPTIEEFDVSGAVKMKALGFENAKNVGVGISGASKAAIDIEANEIDVELSGASKLDIRGKADKVRFNVSGASKANARHMSIERVDAEASGASKIVLGKVNSLNSNTSGASDITRE